MATVIHDGHEQELPIAELVSGDVIRSNAGDLIPSDARLLVLRDLHARESAFTGESLQVDNAANLSSSWLPTLPLAICRSLPDSPSFHSHEIDRPHA